MKSKRKVTRYDYSRFLECDPWDSRILGIYEFWGFHRKKGKLHIDTKRYKKACDKVGITDFLPNGLFEQRNTVYYQPKKEKRHDYKVNIFRDLIGELRSDWDNEYKPLLDKIISPEEASNNYRVEAMSYTSCSDDYDEINMNSQLVRIKRAIEYERISRSLYCQFIQKISAEIDRYTLIFMVECGWKGKDFHFEEFSSFSDGLLSKKDETKISALSKYNSYNCLRKITNFLKHNSLASYEALKKRYPNIVRSVENKTAPKSFENGMFAGDWIIIKENYIDNLLNNLLIFFEDYCRVYLGEDIERAMWDYDDYFYSAQAEMICPEEYLGLPGYESPI